MELLARQPVCGVDRHAEVLTLWEPAGRPIPNEENPQFDVLRTGDPLRNRHVLIERQDGSKLPVISIVAAQKTAGDVVVGAIASFIDISERPKAKAAQLRTQQQLRFVMDSMPQKIWTAARDGRIDYLNPQWMEFTGLSGDDVRARGLFIQTTSRTRSGPGSTALPLAVRFRSSTASSVPTASTGGISAGACRCAMLLRNLSMKMRRSG